MAHRPEASVAKIREPRARKIHSRKRLLRALDHGAKRRLVWVSAQAGAGKTTLAMSWLEARKLPRVWYQLDRGDTDVVTLFHYLTLAAGKRGKTLPSVSLESTMAAFARRFFEAFFAGLPKRTVVVFDDYQEAAGGAVDEALRAAYEAARDGITIIVLSRTGPPATLARAFASGDAELIEASALRLTPDEAHGLARAVRRGKPASRALTDALHRWTDGWAAGVVLLLERPDVAELVRTQPRDAFGGLHDAGGTQRVFDYFATEIFDRESEAVRRFLLRCAVVPTMTDQTAAELTGVPGARAILQSLSRRSLFVKHRGAVPVVYELHPLFRAFLLHQAETHLGADARLELRRRAGALLARDGNVDAGFDLSCEAGDWPACAAVVLANAAPLVSQGRRKTLARWLDALPNDLVIGSAWLLYWRAICAIGHRPEASVPALRDALARFRSDADASGAHLAWSALVTAIVHGGTDLARIDALLDELDAMEAEGLHAPPMLASNIAVGRLMSLLRQPGHHHAKRWVDETFEHWHVAQDPSVRAMTAGLLVPIHCFSGELGRAASVLELLQRKGAGEAEPLAEITRRNAEAVFAWVTADGDTCATRAKLGLAVADASGIVVWDDQLAALGAAAALSRNDLEGAREFLDRMSARAETGTRFAIGNYHYYASWDAAVRGELARASASATSAIDLADDVGMPIARVTSRLMLAHVLCSSDKRAEAQAMVAAAHAIAQASGSSFLVLSCLLGEACLSPDDAELALQAFALGRRLGIYNVFGVFPASLARVCATALAKDIEPRYALELIRRHRLSAGTATTAWPHPIAMRCLGGLAIRLEDEEIALPKKGPNMPVRLLKAIVAFGGRDVSDERLVSALWPDADGARGKTALNTTMHRLRRLLGQEHAIVVQGGAIHLNRDVVGLDVWAFERAAHDLDRAVETGDAIAVVAGAKTLASVYGGQLFAGDESLAVVVAARAQLHHRFLRTLERAAQWLEARGDFASALVLHERALERDDLAEPVYKRVMVCLHELGRDTEALRVFQRCRAALAGRLGVAPSPSTRALSERIKRASAV